MSSSAFVQAALMNATWLTALRTAAGSGVATELVAGVAATTACAVDLCGSSVYPVFTTKASLGR